MKAFGALIALSSLVLFSCASQSEVTSLKGQLSAADSRADQLQGQLSDINSRADQLQGQLSAANSRADQLQGQLSDVNAKSAQLSDQIAGLQGNLSQETAQVMDLSAKLADLQKSNTSLTGNLDSIKAQEAGYEAQINALNQDRASLQQQISGLQEQSATLAKIEQQRVADMNTRIAELQKLFSKELASGDMQIKQYRDVLVISVKDSVFFVPDWPTMLPGGQAILTKLAPIFKQSPDMIRVEGNTAVAISSAASKRVYPTSWFLGAARSAAVVTFLQNQGVNPKQLVASSFGEYHPVASNTTEAGKAMNRRVDFVMLPGPLYDPGTLKTAQIEQPSTVAQLPQK